MNIWDTDTLNHEATPEDQRGEAISSLSDTKQSVIFSSHVQIHIYKIKQSPVTTNSNVTNKTKYI